MSETQSILYPAFQKYYSALKNLDKFRKHNDFFENISYLDNFFSEMRSVTFVLQKSIANTSFKELYEQKCAEYFATELSRWFNEKRVEVQHKNPFALEKRFL